MTNLPQALSRVILTENDEILHVPVNYDRLIEEAALAGKYQRIHELVNSQNIPRVGSGLVEQDLVLVCFGQETPVEVMNAKLKERNLKHATIWELLALGEHFPSKQCDSIIRAYGSACQGESYVHEKWRPTPVSPGLGVNDSDRYVSMSWNEAHVAHHIRVLCMAA